MERWKLFRLRGRRTFATAVLLSLLFWMAAVPPSSARAEDTSAKEPVAKDTVAKEPAAEEPAAEEPALETTSKPARAATLPPLPFNGPQIGPLFKQGFPDDVERWTTAFVPESLDMLTPIEMPTDEDRWIRVDLSEQLVIAYEGEKPVRGFVVSSGLPRTPTVTGEFRIRTKVRAQRMTGGDPSIGTYYDLPNVEWVQYFYADYSFHGTYWHRNFGEPMSHGCLNMTIRDAKWLFDWAGPEWDGETTWYAASPDNPGTLVIVTE